MNLGTKRIEAPCYKCKDRTVEPNCHTECKKYKNYREVVEADKKNKDKEKW